MKAGSFLLVLSVFVSGCASTGSSADGAVAKADDSNVRCERYKPIGSNMTERRCYEIGSDEDRARQEQEAEMRRRARGG